MKYRVSQWLDTKQPAVVFGIEAQIANHWYPCLEDGQPLAFATHELASTKRDELQGSVRFFHKVNP